MVIFNSYVKLPEGTNNNTLLLADLVEDIEVELEWTVDC